MTVAQLIVHLQTFYQSLTVYRGKQDEDGMEVLSLLENDDVQTVSRNVYGARSKSYENTEVVVIGWELL